MIQMQNLKQVLTIDDRRKKTVTIPGWKLKDEDGVEKPATFLVKSMSMRLRAIILDKGEVNPETGIPKFEKLFPELLATCVFYPENPRQRVYTEEEAQVLIDMDADNVQILINAIMEVSAVTGDAVDNFPKKTEVQQ